MSAASWGQFLVMIAVVLVTAAAARPLHGRRCTATAKAPGDRVFRPDRARVLPDLPDRPRERAALDGLHVLAARVQRGLVPASCTCFQRLQGALPFNPTDMPAVRPDLSFNTAVSFMTNTNWQSYGGEATMSHLTQMVGLAVQNFVSAAAGMAVIGGADPRPGPPPGRRRSATSGST